MFRMMVGVNKFLLHLTKHSYLRLV